MSVHLKHKRQIPPTPTANGVNGAETVDPSNAASTGLATDSNGSTAAVTAPALAPSNTVADLTSTSTSVSSSAASSATSSAPKSSSSNISVGAAIGACVGAVGAVIVLVLVALYFYRRYTRDLKRQALAASEKRAVRAKGNNDRSRKRSLENWNKMQEVGEVGKMQSKPVLSPTGLEKMTMFQKSPTIQSPMSDKVTEENSPGPYDHPFARYHPTLAKTVSESPPLSQRHLLGRSDPESAQSVSWDGETAGTDTFMSLRSTDIEKPSGNTLSKAIPTPPAVEHQLHRWESAEVLHFDANAKVEEKERVKDRKDSGSVKSNQRKRSVDNPFFGAQEFSGNGSATPPSPAPLSLKAQGKQRAIDPFTDDAAAPPPRLPFGHNPSQSDASYNSDRAIQSLINVLDVSEDDIQERLRIASMQPSVLSTFSYQGEEDETSSFPHPPP